MLYSVRFYLSILFAIYFCAINFAIADDANNLNSVYFDNRNINQNTSNMQDNQQKYSYNNNQNNQPRQSQLNNNQFEDDNNLQHNLQQNNNNQNNQWQNNNNQQQFNQNLNQSQNQFNNNQTQSNSNQNNQPSQNQLNINQNQMQNVNQLDNTQNNQRKIVDDKIRYNTQSKKSQEYFKFSPADFSEYETFSYDRNSKNSNLYLNRKNCPYKTNETLAKFLVGKWSSSLANSDMPYYISALFMVANNYIDQAILLPTKTNEIRSQNEMRYGYFMDFLALSPKVMRVLDVHEINLACGMVSYNGKYDIQVAKEKNRAKVLNAKFSFVYQYFDNPQPLVINQEWLRSIFARTLDQLLQKYTYQKHNGKMTAMHLPNDKHAQLSTKAKSKLYDIFFNNPYFKARFSDQFGSKQDFITKKISLVDVIDFMYMHDLIKVEKDTVTIDRNPGWYIIMHNSGIIID